MEDETSQTDDMARRLTCRRVVRELVERNDWALLQEDELVEMVLDSLQSGASLTELERAAKYHYTTVLYKACRQAEDLDRRERGYSELSRYLFRAAYNRWPDLAEDATQRALMLVYEQIDRCRHPGAFLAFALYKLRHAFQKEERVRRWIVQGRVAGNRLPFGSHLEREEYLRMLIEAIGRLPDKRQQKTILLRFLGGLSDKEIGARLGITKDHVRVLRHRGLRKLQKDEPLRSYFEVAGGEIGDGGQ